MQAEYVASYRGLGGSGVTRGCRYMFAGASDADAYARIEGAAIRQYEAMQNGPYYRLSVARGIFPETPPASFDELLDRLEFAAGGPEAVATRLRRYVETSGVDRFDVMMHIPGVTPDDLRRSMRIFSEEVAPLLGGLVSEPAR